MNQTDLKRHSTSERPQEEANAWLPLAVGFVVLVVLTVFAIFNISLVAQTFSWQPVVGALTTIGGIAACVAGISAGRRGHFEIAGALMVAGIVLAGLVGSVLYAGLGLSIGVAVMALSLTVAILVLPVRWASWAMLAGVVAGITCGLIDFFSPEIQFDADTASYYLIGVVVIAIVALSAMMIWQIRSLSLANKLLIAFLFVTLLAAGTTTFLSAQATTRSLTASVGSLQHSLADAHSKSIGDLLERQLDILETLALNDDLQEKVKDANLFYTGDSASIQSKLERFDEQWKISVAADDPSGALVQSRLGNMAARDLREFSQDFPDHVEVFITDQYGGLVAATDLTSDYYQADEEWWQAAWNEGKGSSYFGSPDFDESAGVFSINIAVPIHEIETQEIIGVLRTTYMLNALYTFLSTVRQNEAGDAEVLFAGEPALLLRNDGEVVDARPDLVQELKAASAYDYTQMIYEGDPVLVSQAVVGSSAGNPVIEALGWRMIIKRDLVDALSPVAAQTRSTLMATMLVIGLVVGAAIVLAQVLARPITQLTAVAAKIRAGDINAQARVETQDEIGELAATFNSMTKELRLTLEGLEKRVVDRTRELALAGEVSHVLSQELELDQLLKSAVELIQSRFNLYYTQIYLHNPSQQSLALQAGSGTAGIELQRRGHRLPVSSASINGKAAVDKKPVVVEDVTQSPNFRPNPLLPETRSEAAIPMLIGDRLVGVLDLQASHPGAFHVDSLPAFQALAGQLAVAVENAALFAQVQQAQIEVESRMRAQTHKGWMDFLDGVHHTERMGYKYEEGTVVASTEGTNFGEGHEALQVPIVVAGETLGALAFESRPDRAWTSAQIDLVTGVAVQAARQMENLHLLAQAEHYRMEAEEIARRLTHQGWDEYQKDLQARLSFVYDQSQVHIEEPVESSARDLTYHHALVVRDTPIGDLDFEGSQPLAEHDLALIQSVADSLSAHIDSLRLTAQTQVALSNMETLNEVTRAASRTLELDVVLDETLERILGVSGFSAGLISIEDLATQRLQLVVHRNLPAAMVTKLTTVGLEGTPCDVVFQSGDTVIISDLDRLPDDLHATGLEGGFVRQAMQRPLAMGFHSYFGLALSTKGHIVGTVCLFDPGNLTINPAKFTMLEAIGQQIGILVENARLFQGTQKALSRTESLYEAIAEMNRAESYDQVLSTLASHTLLGQADQLLMMGVLDRPMVAGQTPEWIYPVAWSSQQPVDVARRYPAAVIGLAIEGGFYQHETTALGGLDARSPMMQALQGLFNFDQPVASVSGVPLTLGGQVIGFVIGLYSQTTEPDEEELSQLRAVAGQAAIAVESRLLLEQAQAKARQEQRLREVSAKVFAASDVDAILRRAVEQVGRTLGTQAYIYLGDGSNSNGGSIDKKLQDGEQTPDEPELVKM